MVSPISCSVIQCFAKSLLGSFGLPDHCFHLIPLLSRNLTDAEENNVQNFNNKSLIFHNLQNIINQLNVILIVRQNYSGWTPEITIISGHLNEL